MSKFATDVADELLAARYNHGPLKSAHEAYAVILEEVDELWDEIKKKSSERDKNRMYEELVQVAAMCHRFAIDVLGGN